MRHSSVITIWSADVPRDFANQQMSTTMVSMPSASVLQASPQQSRATPMQAGASAHRRSTASQPTMVDYVSPQKAAQAPVLPQQSPPQPRSPRQAAASSPLIGMLHRASQQQQRSPQQQQRSSPQQQAQPLLVFGTAAGLFGGGSSAAGAANTSVAQQQAAGHGRAATGFRQDPDGAVNLWPESSKLQWPGR